MKMRLKDIYFTVGIGLITGAVAWRLVVFLNLPRVYGISYAWLVLLFPAFCVFSFLAGLLLSKINKTFLQFARFGIIGASNAFIDYGYLNILIAYTGIHSGAWFSVFKGISFIVATINSYFLNKYWAFDSGSKPSNHSEIIKFFGISIFAITVNITVASIVVNVINPMWGLSPGIWANVGAITGSIAALIFNFAGYKFLVFKTVK
jgi:putative flippase GtrA